MFGLVVVAVIAVYLVVSLMVVLWARSWARKRSFSPTKAGWLAALVMYLLVAWEQVPTYVVHKLYCAMEVGYWVYKTPSQWKEENPGVAVTLYPVKENVARHRLRDGGTGEILNERFVEESRVFKFPLLPVAVLHDVVVDSLTDEVMARSVAVSSGYGTWETGGWNSWKFWVGADTCWPKKSRIRSDIREFKYIHGGFE